MCPSPRAQIFSPTFTPEQVVEAVKPGPSGTAPLPCPKEVKIQKQSPKGKAKSEGRMTGTAPMAGGTDH